MEQVLIVDADKCTGCKICELICSMTKLNEFNPKKSYIKVLRNKEMDINIVALDAKCDYCGECIKWCIPKAIRFVDLHEAITKWKGAKVGSMPAPLISSS